MVFTDIDKKRGKYESYSRNVGDDDVRGVVKS